MRLGPPRRPGDRIVLGFDTATPATAVAVMRPDGWAFEERDDPAAEERPAHASRLLDLVERALEQADASWEDVERLAVGVGPGGFTGLRIGIATGRALAQSRGLALVGVGSLEALALGAAAPVRGRVLGAMRAGAAPAAPGVFAVSGQPVLAVIDARRGEAFAAAWATGAAEGGDALDLGARLLEPAALEPDALAAAVAGLPAAPLAVGDGAVRFRGALETAGATVPADGSAVHRLSAVQVCRLGAASPPADRDALLPDYRREPDARPR